MYAYVYIYIYIYIHMPRLVNATLEPHPMGTVTGVSGQDTGGSYSQSAN